MKSKQIRLQQRQAEQHAKAGASNQQGRPSDNQSSAANPGQGAKSGRKANKSNK